MSDQPMRCGDAAPYLSAFGDGELEDALRVRVQAHVAGCERCAAEVRRYAAIGDLVGTLPRSTPSSEVLDRVLAAVRPAAPSPVTRESLLRKPKLLAPRSLPPLLRSHADGPAVVRPVWRTRRPPTAAARVIPALAAALLIAFSVFAFSRFPLGDRLRGSRPVATPQPVAAVLAETQRQASAQQTTLGFAPVVPAYLPPGVALRHVTVGAEPTDPVLRYLDMTWALAFPLAATLHVRESPLPLEKRGDFLQAADSDTALTWSLGPYQWLPGLVRGAPSHCAVGEARPGMSISVDVDTLGSGGACDTSDLTAINVLRLTSLSLDAPYTPLTVRGPASSTLVLHFRAYKTVPGGYSWDVYVNPMQQRTRITVSDPHGAPLYTDLIANNSVTRLDPRSGHYQRLCACMTAPEPSQLATSVVTFFAAANTLLGSGELWNVGLTQVPKGLVGVGRAYALVLVGAPYPTTIYVDLTTKQILGAQVDYQAMQRPGGPGASSKLTPAGTCPSFEQIQYQHVGAQPAGTFDFTPPSGYTEGPVTQQTVTC